MSVGLQRLRDDADAIRKGAVDKGEDPTIVDRALELDTRRRMLLGEGDALKAERNAASKRIGEAIKGGARPDGDEVAELKAASVAQSVSVTGCQVWCQLKSPTGTAHAGVPMLDPKVKRWVKRWKNSTYQGSALAMASCVKAGSESMKARFGIRAYSSRQNHDPPERLMKRSASAQKRCTVSRGAP